MNTSEMLRIVADDYEQSQRVRIAKGEQIRSIVRGVDTALQEAGFDEADELLAAIKRGESTAPHPYLAWAYEMSWHQERRAFDEMTELVTEHPAWPWLEAVKGIGPTLACKLLARLDLDRARSASSFWCYCGLGTVPGKKYRCPKCNRLDVYPENHNVTGKHRGCKELSVMVAGPEDGVRAAQPRAERGQPRGYDAYAKKVMYLIATQFVKMPGKSFYEAEYRRKRAYYERERAGWEKGRKHYSALRHVEKLFLSHLYEVWCEATDREPCATYAEEHLGHSSDDIIGAWEVVEWEAKQADAAA